LAPSASADEDSGSETDDGQVYCICRKGDNHSLMIECEGGCQEWYHASCVSVDPDDAKNLLDKYVCAQCEIPGEKHTLWKIMCRLTGCRKPARLPSSKYCSDEHRRQWGQRMVGNMPQGTRSTPGGALTSQQLKAILKQTSSAKEFHALGKAPKLVHPPTKFAWDKILNPEEKDRLVEIQNGKEELERRRAGFNDREKFVRILAKNVSTKMEELKGDGIKDLICGYSNKLAMNEEELAVWCASGEGAQALETGKFAGEICMKRGCGRHKQWMKMSIQDVNFERSEISKALAKLQKEREGIYERAEIRAASTLR
jgi:COMPASS component SPP1